jgi:hypothetical protein
MSDIPFDADARQTSPFISIWWRPRQTIERIVASRPIIWFCHWPRLAARRRLPAC